jgi:hypothetical protein
MRKIKTYKIFESEISKIDNLKEEILEILEDIKLKLDGDLKVLGLYEENESVFMIELNTEAYEMKGSDSEHEDKVEFTLDESDIADIKSVINYLGQNGYDQIRLSISKDDEDNFEELDDVINADHAKERLDEITNEQIECIQIHFGLDNR